MCSSDGWATDGWRWRWRWREKQQQQQAVKLKCEMVKKRQNGGLRIMYNPCELYLTSGGAWTPNCIMRRLLAHDGRFRRCCCCLLRYTAADDYILRRIKKFSCRVYDTFSIDVSGVNLECLRMNFDTQILRSYIRRKQRFAGQSNFVTSGPRLPETDK